VWFVTAAVSFALCLILVLASMAFRDKGSDER
jgi:hypothetical protein